MNGVVRRPRAYWKCYLKLSLVSCPIALYPAVSSSERVSFNRISKKTGNRLKQQQVDAETGEPVETEDVARPSHLGNGPSPQTADDHPDPPPLTPTPPLPPDPLSPPP